jgi:hypothetical protein
MSSYELATRPESAKHTVRIGWHASLRTYFAQVLNLDHDPAIRVGCAFAEITDPTVAIETVSRTRTSPPDCCPS